MASKIAVSSAARASASCCAWWAICFSASNWRFTSSTRRRRRRVEEVNRQLEAEKQIAHQAQQEAEARAAELTAIFEAMTEGVFVFDVRGEIRYTNPAYRSTLGLEENADPSLLLLDNRSSWMDSR